MNLTLWSALPLISKSFIARHISAIDNLVFSLVCYQLISRYSQGNKIVKNIKTQECNKSCRCFI